jgi:hypothetical protein
VRESEGVGGSAVHAALRIGLAASFVAFAWLILGFATSAFASEEPPPQHHSVLGAVAALGTVAPAVTNLSPVLQLVAQPEQSPPTAQRISTAARIPAAGRIPAVVHRIVAEIPIVKQALPAVLSVQPTAELASVVDILSGSSATSGGLLTGVSAALPVAVSPTFVAVPSPLSDLVPAAHSADALIADPAQPIRVPAPSPDPAGAVSGSNSSGSPGSGSAAFATAERSGFAAPGFVVASAGALNEALPNSLVLDPGSSPD